MNHETIHTEAIAVVARYKRCEIELIEILEKVWTHRTFQHYDCGSLFEYAVKHLKLSESVTSIYNKIVKKTLQVSGFKEEIRSGRITISNASLICSVINEENKAKWFAQAQNSKRQLEKEIAMASPRTAIKEKTKLKNCGTELRHEITFGVSEEHFQKMQRALDLLSQQLGRYATLEDLSMASLNLFLDKKDPLRKSSPGTIHSQAAKAKNPRALKPTLKRQVHHKTESQCAHIDESGARCQQRRHLHIHHIKPISEGGANTLDNLTILCSGHHQMHHFSSQHSYAEKLNRSKDWQE